MKLKKHVGKIASTDSRCVVAYMQIPGREDHALVIPTDALPPRVEQAVMDLLESNEGQAEATLGNVLGRRIMENGKSVLQALHESGYLQPVPVSNVLMLPAPNMPFPLEQILRDMGKHVPQNTSQPRFADAAMQKYNPHTANQSADEREQATAKAKMILIEAEMLQEEADRKRATAYAIAPHLEPNTKITEAPKAKAPKVAPVAVADVAEKKVRTSRRKVEKSS